MKLHEALGDRQAEPGTGRFSARRRFDLLECLENPILIFLGYADACIGDGNPDLVAPSIGLDPNPSTPQE